MILLRDAIGEIRSGEEKITKSLQLFMNLDIFIHQNTIK